MNIILLFFSVKYKGDWDKIYKALEDKEKVTMQEIVELEQKIANEGWVVKTIIDKDYPEQLKQAYKPPFVVFMKGNEKLLENELVALSGEISDEDSIKRINEFLPELTKTNSLVIPSSGNVKVNEDIAAANDSGTVHVLGGGIDKVQPSAIKEKDLIISEYPYEVQSSGDRKLNSDRIVAALSKEYVLLNSINDGKAKHLISSFLNLGKEIYCFPGDGSDKDGNSQLIKEGANLITGIKDLAQSSNTR